MRIRAWGLTDPGRVRTNNEDAFFVDGAKGLVVVCDGMGGHSSGEVASHLAVDTFSTLFGAADTSRFDSSRPQGSMFKPEAAELVAASRLANTRIHATATLGTDQRGMGTTLVAARFCADGSVAIVNVGDSRAYRLRAGELVQLTRDHTLLSDMIEDGELSESDARTFREKNVLSRSLGTSPTVKVGLRVDSALPGDLYLLCSDGLHGVLGDDVIQALLLGRGDDLEGLARLLVDEANKRGGPDNITMGLAVVDESNSASPGSPLVTDLTDNESDYAKRRRAVACLFNLPGRKSRLPVHAAVGGVVLLAAIAAVLLLSRPARMVRGPGARLVVQVQPPQAAARAKVEHNGVVLTGAVDVAPDSAYALSVSAPGYSRRDTSITVRAALETCVVSLDPAAYVAITAINATPPIEMQATPRKGKPVHRSISDPYGGVVGIPPGTYGFTVQWGGGRPFSKPNVTVDPGDTVYITQNQSGGSLRSVPLPALDKELSR